jgi:hypothetical protein
MKANKLVADFFKAVKDARKRTTLIREIARKNFQTIDELETFLNSQTKRKH